MPLPRGTYDVELRIGVPRTQLVDWKISCAGAERAGVVGRSFDDYKEERLAQLTRARSAMAHAREQHARQPAPPVTTTTVIVAPPVATVRTRIGRVVVRPAPVVVHETRAPAPQPQPEPVELEVAPVTELPPGDFGQGVFPARARVVTSNDGVCVVSAIADDPNVSAFFSVTRVRDLGVEEAERKQLLYVGAANTRGRMTEHLVAYGADPLAKQRRIEAEAKAAAEAERNRGIELAAQRERENQLNVERRQRAEAEAVLRRQREAIEAAQRQRRLAREAALVWEREAPARARADLLIRQTEVSIKWRLTIIAWLVGECHADPDRRGRIARGEAQRKRELQSRLEIRLEIERIERERLIRIRMEKDRRDRERLATESNAREEARREEARARTNEAIRIRSTISGSLISFGAKLRPPMPAVRIENPGLAPFDGAQWASGSWEWISIRGEWVWRGGGWRDSTRFGHAGGETIVHTEVSSPTIPTVISVPPTPGVVIEVGGIVRPERPRPTYEESHTNDRPRPNYQPQPRPRPRPTYQPKGDPKRPTKATVRGRRDDDRKDRR